MELYNDGYKFKSLNWCKLSDNYYRNGEITKSQAALDSAKRIISTHQENLYCKYMESLLLLILLGLPSGILPQLYPADSSGEG